MPVPLKIAKALSSVFKKFYESALKREINRAKDEYYTKYREDIRNNPHLKERQKLTDLQYCARETADHMRSHATCLRGESRTRAMYEIKEFCLDIMNKGDITPETAQILLYDSAFFYGLLKDPPDGEGMSLEEKDNITQSLLDFCIKNHSSGHVNLRSAIDYLNKLSTPRTFFKTILPWTEEQIKKLPPAPDLQTLTDLHLVFKEAAHRPVLMGVKPPSLGFEYVNDIVAVAPNLSAMQSHGQYRYMPIEDCCVVFKNVVDAATYEPLVICNHGVLGISDMAALADLHEELRGTKSGQQHIEFLSRVARSAPA